VTVVPETAVAVQDSDSKIMVNTEENYGEYRGKQLTAIAIDNRLSKAERCQHWLSLHNEIATMMCKVKPSKKGQQSTC